MSESCFWDGGQVASTLTARNAGGAQRMPDKENFNAVIDGVTIMGEEVTPTLVSCQYKEPGNTQDNLSVVTFRKQAHPQNSEQAQGWEETTVNDTLNVFDNGEARTPTLVLENHPADSRVKICEDGVFQTLSSRMGTGGNNVPMVMEDKEITIKDYNKCFEEKAYLVGKALNCKQCPHYENCERGKAYFSEGLAKKNNAVVRRLTPLECTRLQGFPDNWCDIGDWVDGNGKKHKDSDSAKYKALGNSIAIPYWSWMAERMVKCLKEDGVENPTMASLFDGIGGFPLSYMKAGCEPLWASEVEDYPIAVTKYHFGDEETGNKGDIDKYL